MSVEDVTIAAGTDFRRGYLSAVTDFCASVDGQVVEPEGYLSVAREVFISGGGNPTTYGMLGFVYCKVLLSRLIRVGSLSVL